MFVPISDSQISTYVTHFCIFVKLENENAMNLQGYNMHINNLNGIINYFYLQVRHPVLPITNI